MQAAGQQHCCRELAVAASTAVNHAHRLVPPGLPWCRIPRAQTVSATARRRTSTAVAPSAHHAASCCSASSTPTATPASAGPARGVLPSPPPATTALPPATSLMSTGAPGWERGCLWGRNAGSAAAAAARVRSAPASPPTPNPPGSCPCCSGGGVCPLCPDGKKCRLSSDCESENCVEGLCSPRAPNCTDGALPAWVGMGRRPPTPGWVLMGCSRSRRHCLLNHSSAAWLCPPFQQASRTVRRRTWTAAARTAHNAPSAGRAL